MDGQRNKAIFSRTTSPNRQVDRENWNKKVLVKTFEQKYKYVKDMASNIIVEDVIPRVILEAENRGQHHGRYGHKEETININANDDDTCDLVSEAPTSIALCLSNVEEDLLIERHYTDKEDDDFAGDFISSVLTTIASETENFHLSSEYDDTENKKAEKEGEEDEMIDLFIATMMTDITRYTALPDEEKVTSVTIPEAEDNTEKKLISDSFITDIQQNLFRDENEEEEKDKKEKIGDRLEEKEDDNDEEKCVSLAAEKNGLLLANRNFGNGHVMDKNTQGRRQEDFDGKCSIFAKVKGQQNDVTHINLENVSDGNVETLNLLKQKRKNKPSFGARMLGWLRRAFKNKTPSRSCTCLFFGCVKSNKVHPCHDDVLFGGHN